MTKQTKSPATMVLIPRAAQFFPTKKSRTDSAHRNKKYTAKDFDTYNDWFYFIHIDPVQRAMHAFGMYVGTFFFGVLIFNFDWTPLSLLHYLLGVFFFYVLGIISHLIYDRGSARSTPGKFIHTLPAVVKVNLLTTFGRYDRSLRGFVKKYPFVSEAYDLVDIERASLFSYLSGRQQLNCD